MIPYKGAITPLVLILMLLFCVTPALASTSSSGSSGSSGSAVASGRMSEKEFKDMLQKVLKEDPSLVINLLRTNSLAAMGALNDGQRDAVEERKAELIRSWDAQMNQPKAIAISDRPIKGYSGAPVLIAVFSDFTCPYCARTAALIDDILAQNPTTVRFIFKHRPLASHVYSKIAAQYFIAASMQSYDRAWNLYKGMFEGREELIKNGENFLLPLAEKVGLDTKRLRMDIAGLQVAKILNEDMKEANSLGFDGAPYLLVNNLIIPGAPSSDLLQMAIDKARKGK